jgi:hypothetical protein
VVRVCVCLVAYVYRFTNLCVPDPTMYMPIVAGFTMLAALETGLEAGAGWKTFTWPWPHVIRVSVVAFVIGVSMNFPAVSVWHACG